MIIGATEQGEERTFGCIDFGGTYKILKNKNFNRGLNIKVSIVKCGKNRRRTINLNLYI